MIFAFVLSGLCINILHFSWLESISIALGLLVYICGFYLIYARWKETKSIKEALKDNIFNTCIILWICFVTCVIVIRKCG